MNEKLVSVVVPAYNRAAYIERTVDSVLAQTYPHVELIVGDDGSTDGTYEILQRYESEGKLTLLTHPERVNKGQSATLNSALDQARGEYICVLDSDDMFAPNKLAMQVDYLERHLDLGLVYSNGHAVDKHDNILYPMLPENHREGNDPCRLLLDCYFLLPQNAMVRKAVFDQAGRFEESFRSAQDHDMLLRIAEITTIAYIPDFLFYYRRHEDSISSRQQDLRWKTGFEILRRAAQRYPYPRSIVRRRRAVLHYRMSQVHRAQGYKAKALPHLVLAGLLDPTRGLAVAMGKEKG